MVASPSLSLRLLLWKRMTSVATNSPAVDGGALTNGKHAAGTVSCSLLIPSFPDFINIYRVPTVCQASCLGLGLQQRTHKNVCSQGSEI